MIDTTSPVIEIGDVEQVSDSKYIVPIDVNEKSELRYSYPGLTRSKRICSSCSDSRRAFYFRSVPDYVDIFAIDKAENEATKRVYL